MLGFIKGTTENGYYDAAVKIKIFLSVLSLPLVQSFFPEFLIISKREKRRSFQELQKGAKFCVLAVGTSLCLFYHLCETIHLFIIGYNV